LSSVIEKAVNGNTSRKKTVRKRIILPYAVFFQYLTDSEKRDKIIKIINQDEGIAMVVETLSNITQDEAEYARLSNLIKSELDWRTGLFEAENKGRSEGRNEGLIDGRNEEKLENARKMKLIGFLTEQIQGVTGLSAEIIAQL
jgi:predicted transposase/invertase (TIGR01784 family)